MSDYHFGIDYDMWLYPQVHWWDSDCDDDLPEHIEAANIEGTLLVNADDAIEQVRKLQAENAELRVSYDTLERIATEQLTVYAEYEQSWRDENAKLRELVRRMFYAVNPSDRGQLLVNVAELGIEVGE